MFFDSKVLRTLYHSVQVLRPRPLVFPIRRSACNIGTRFSLIGFGIPDMIAPVTPHPIIFALGFFY